MIYRSFPNRRTFLRGLTVGAAGPGVFSFARADEPRPDYRACILLLMRGGPSQFETFDPKPGHACGGPTRAIDTAVNGIRIAEHWPNVAKAMKDIAIVRCVSHGEGRHDRALSLVLPFTGSVLRPGIDLSGETASVRDRYGCSPFGDRCLVARRLVESGERFVTVESHGWDTHQDNFDRVRLLAEEVDPAFAALVYDLKDGGLLETTRVVWMGEFGRSPRINAHGGRDHYPRAFSATIAGGGVRGGRVIGRTSDDGSFVTDRPVRIEELFACGRDVHTRL